MSITLIDVEKGKYFQIVSGWVVFAIPSYLFLNSFSFWHLTITHLEGWWFGKPIFWHWVRFFLCNKRKQSIEWQSYMDYYTTSCSAITASTKTVKLSLHPTRVSCRNHFSLSGANGFLLKLSHQSYLQFVWIRFLRFQTPSNFHAMKSNNHCRGKW